jgi:hypothetical protein
MILGWAPFWLASVFLGQTAVVWNVEIGRKTSVHQLKYLSTVPFEVFFLFSDIRVAKTKNVFNEDILHIRDSLFIITFTTFRNCLKWVLISPFYR